MSHDHAHNDAHDASCKCCTEVLLSCNLLEVELLSQSSAMEKLRSEVSLFLGTGCDECAGTAIQKATERLDYFGEYLGEERVTAIVNEMEQRFAQSTGEADLWHVIRGGGEREQEELRTKLTPEQRDAA